MSGIALAPGWYRKRYRPTGAACTHGQPILLGKPFWSEDGYARRHAFKITGHTPPRAEHVALTYAGLYHLKKNAAWLDAPPRVGVKGEDCSAAVQDAEQRMAEFEEEST